MVSKFKDLAFWISLTLTTVSGFFIVTNHSGLALRILNFSFYILTVGVFLYVKDIFNEK